VAAPAVLSAAELNELVAGAFVRPDGERWRVEEVTDTGVVVALSVGPVHGRPGGTVSGPTMMGLADGAAWMATLSRIGPVLMAVTSNLTVEFLRRPPLGETLRARAELLRLGRRLSVTDVRLVSGGALVAHATVTYAIPGTV
jgi:uncharacterized protein (TIGR00369 family)